MAKCEVCGKGVTFGCNVSHSNRKTNRTFKPNIRKVKVVDNGTHKTVNVCSRCLRSNKVTRAIQVNTINLEALSLRGCFCLTSSFPQKKK